MYCRDLDAKCWFQNYTRESDSAGGVVGPHNPNSKIPGLIPQASHPANRSRRANRLSGIGGLSSEVAPGLARSRFCRRLTLEVAQRHRGRATLGRSANLTRATNGRAPCHYCGPCYHGCVTHSYFNSAFTTVADALKTGKCTHIPYAMVWQVLMDSPRNRARGVLYVDRRTREVREVRVKVVILCAQALESVRILFNSATREYAGGLANSSGVLGHYLMDHVFGVSVAGELPDFPGKASVNGPRRNIQGSYPRSRDGRQPEWLWRVPGAVGESR
jgi:choline dehydrogenase-like flavoprotein